MRLDHRAEPGQRGAVGKPRPALLPRVLQGDLPRKRHHQRGKLHAEVDGLPSQLRAVLPALKHLDCLRDLVRIADAPAERGVHPCDKGRRTPTCRLRAGHKGAGEGSRLVQGLHEGALPALDVEDERPRALGELLRQYRAGDERNRRNRAGHVPQRVELLVRRAYLLGLHRHGHADVGDDGAERVEGKRAAVAGDRLELVCRAAGDAEPPPRQGRDGDAARGRKRLHHERELVADAAGGVLVCRRHGQPAPLQAGTGAHHRVGEVGRLPLVHATAADRHGEGAHLVVGHGSPREPLDELSYLRRTERMSFALFVKN